MSASFRYQLFEVFGIEIEYMIVDRATYMPVPLASVLLTDGSGVVRNSLPKGAVTISNELASHVIELKADPPTADLAGLAADLQRVVGELNALLEPHHAILAPGGMHPLMDPRTEGALWTHGDAEIYAWYDRTFDCHRHGWFNLQSCHLNLPFATEAEFGRLHDAVILLLPLLPALAASSPFREGVYEGFLDTRIDVYANNQKRFPAITGAIIPESIRDEATYRERILAPAYAAVKPFDPDGLIESDWLNSRGAIARFDRGAIEIRLLDTQEHPAADVAICALLIAVLKRLLALGEGRLAELVARHTPEERREQLLQVAREGRHAPMQQGELAEALGLSGASATVGDFWKGVSAGGTCPAIEYILAEGALAERMLRRVGPQPSREALVGVVRDLAQAMATGRAFPGKDEA